KAISHKQGLSLFLISSSLPTKHYKLPFPFLAVMMLAAELRCHCIQTATGIMLSKHLANVEIIPKGPHCNTVEIIATLKNSQQICLDPQAKWVKMVINRILQSDFPLVQIKRTFN
uniref:C-X-C motif chemokine n=1 Tax=Calidris pygmaea TaxID=425635 RepID=A0A8C3J663_9CHAR